MDARHGIGRFFFGISILAAVAVYPAGRCLGQAGAATPPTTRPVLKARNDVPGLTNFAQVSPGLYRGAQPTAEGFGELKKLGVKTVVNLRSGHSDRSKLKGTGLQYVRFQCQAWHPEEVDVVNFLKLMSDPANHPVFVHCAQGADRTGMMVAAYRIVEEGWTVKEAMAELPNFKFHTVWTGISKYLKAFDVQATKKKVQKATMPKIEVVK